MGRKRFVFLMIGLFFSVLVAGTALVASAGQTARALQHPANKSGVMGRIFFTDNGSGPIVTGTATGLSPSTVGRYITLVYDKGSVPGGPTNCEPTVLLPGMFVGIWVSDVAGNGLLQQLAPPSAIAPLGTFDTVSIRDTTINGGFGPTAVVACGEVAVNP